MSTNGSTRARLKKWWEATGLAVLLAALGWSVQFIWTSQLTTFRTVQILERELAPIRDQMGASGVLMAHFDTVAAHGRLRLAELARRRGTDLHADSTQEAIADVARSAALDSARLSGLSGLDLSAADRQVLELSIAALGAEFRLLASLNAGDLRAELMAFDALRPAGEALETAWAIRAQLDDAWRDQIEAIKRDAEGEWRAFRLQAIVAAILFPLSWLGLSLLFNYTFFGSVVPWLQRRTQTPMVPAETADADVPPSSSST